MDETRELECGCKARANDLTVVEPCSAHVSSDPRKVAKMYGAKMTPEEVARLKAELGLPDDE